MASSRLGLAVPALPRFPGRSRSQRKPSARASLADLMSWPGRSALASPIAGSVRSLVSKPRRGRRPELHRLTGRPARAGSRAGPSAPRRSGRAGTMSSPPSGGRYRPWWPPRWPSSPPRRRARRAPRPWSSRTPSGEGRGPPSGSSAGRCARRRRRCGLGRDRLGGLAHARLAGRLRGTWVERGECLAQALGLVGELVKVLVDLFTQTVDHVAHFLVVGAGRSYTAATGPAVGADVWLRSRKLSGPRPCRCRSSGRARISAGLSCDGSGWVARL